MEEIIDDVKVDAKHSFEDTYLPVTKAKETYGDRLSLVGGIDMDVLVRGSPTDVREYTIRVIETCKPGGRYCLGSGNTVANYIPLENYLTIIDAGLEHAWYT
jgi:uroporphyrinogen decarboxylase